MVIDLFDQRATEATDHRETGEKLRKETEQAYCQKHFGWKPAIRKAIAELDRNFALVD